MMSEEEQEEENKKQSDESGSGRTKKKEKIRLRQEMVTRRMRESEWRLTWRQVAHTSRPRLGRL